MRWWILELYIFGDQFLTCLLKPLYSATLKETFTGFFLNPVQSFLTSVKKTASGNPLILSFSSSANCTIGICLSSFDSKFWLWFRTNADWSLILLRDLDWIDNGKPVCLLPFSIKVCPLCLFISCFDESLPWLTYNKVSLSFQHHLMMKLLMTVYFLSSYHISEESASLIGRQETRDRM